MHGSYLWAAISFANSQPIATPHSQFDVRHIYSVMQNEACTEECWQLCKPRQCKQCALTPLLVMQWVMVSLTTDKPMVYSGTEAPCAYGELISIGAYQVSQSRLGLVVGPRILAWFTCT